MVCVFVCLSVFYLYFHLLHTFWGRLEHPIYIYKHGVCASVLQEARPSVRSVFYWLELRVMGITQCQGYPIGWNSG